VALTVAAAVVLLGAATALGLVHRAASPAPLERYLPAVTPFTVVGAGLLDGVNPCAFTVLLLLIAALFSTTQVGTSGAAAARARVIALGMVYVGAVFVTYLTLGTGLIAVGRGFTGSHLPSRVGAIASVLLGLWMLKDAMIPAAGPQLHAPHGWTKRAQGVARRATVPALVLGGVLIGLCTVPCSGAIYLAVLAMLASDPEPLRAYGYLVLYNALFVLPLVGILVVASSRRLLARLARWQERNQQRVRGVIGGSVVVLGLALLATI